jgi:hypothetical protein
MPVIMVDLPTELYDRLIREAKLLGKKPQDRIRGVLEGAIAPAESLRPGAIAEGLTKLRSLLERIPAVRTLSTSGESESMWWVKFKIDIHSSIAWHVVQGLGFVLNSISIEERLPTVFMPVSSPPYLNGGPEDYLNWVIEATIPLLNAGVIADSLSD